MDQHLLQTGKVDLRRVQIFSIKGYKAEVEKLP